MNIERLPILRFLVIMGLDDYYCRMEGLHGGIIESIGPVTLPKASMWIKQKLSDMKLKGGDDEKAKQIPPLP